jgi:hypothetical protein
MVVAADAAVVDSVATTEMPMSFEQALLLQQGDYQADLAQAGELEA